MKSNHIHIRTTDEQKEKLERMATDQGLSLSEFILMKSLSE